MVIITTPLMDQFKSGPIISLLTLRSHRQTLAAMVLAPCGDSTSQRRYYQRLAQAPPRIGVVMTIREELTQHHGAPP